MAAAGHLRCFDDASVMSGTGADEENETAALANSGHDFCSASQVGGSYVEGDYVDALSNAEDIAGVCRVPKGGGVAKVGLRGEEKLEGYVVGEGWIC